MTYAKSGKGIDQYRKVGVQTSVEAADPHRLIQMLMEGALEKIAKAKQFMAHRSVAEKGRHISWAISIIDGLRLSLDKEKGGEIAQNLDALYDYMTRRLVAANADNNPGYLDEVASLLQEIKVGWDAIPPEVRRNPTGEPLAAPADSAAAASVAASRPR